MSIKLKYLVRSGGPNFISSVHGLVRLVRSEKYTQPLVSTCAGTFIHYYNSVIFEVINIDKIVVQCDRELWIL